MAGPEKPRFDLTQIGNADKQNLASTFLSAVQRFYEDPENRARFEAWKAQRQAGRAAETV